MRQRLIEEAKKRINGEDPSHDFDHAMRVLANAEFIASIEGGDLDIIIPAALFHDVIVYPKDSPKSKDSAKDSAEVAREVLQEVYQEDKIVRVEEAILEHSFGNGIKPESIESRIVQDADRLEATGALAIMRTFCSTGQMRRKLYNSTDPFCEQREPESLIYAVDLFFKRLLKVKDLMNTGTASKLAETRTEFLYSFLEQFRDEIELRRIYKQEALY